MTNSLKLIIVLTILTISGCAQRPHKAPIPLITNQNLLEHQKQIQSIDTWQAIGKLGVKTPGDGGSATLRWQQFSTGYHISLNGPLGQGNMSIEGELDRVTFKDGNIPAQSAKTAEELLLKNTGWNIPVTQLAYWVRGLAAPTIEVARYALNAQGLIGELNQAGWNIIYGEYLNTPHANEVVAMPGRITAEYKDIRLTLLIREWQLGNAK